MAIKAAQFNKHSGNLRSFFVLEDERYSDGDIDMVINFPMPLSVNEVEFYKMLYPRFDISSLMRYSDHRIDWDNALPLIESQGCASKKISTSGSISGVWL